MSALVSINKHLSYILTLSLFDQHMDLFLFFDYECNFFVPYHDLTSNRFITLTVVSHLLIILSLLILPLICGFSSADQRSGQQS